MAKEEKLNINEEFDKLLPPTERKSLFDDDEDYNSFRLYIMQQPRGFYTNSKNKLPFSDIKLSSYLEYKSQDTFEKEKKNNHLFFLQQSQKGKIDYCSAAGYYDKYKKVFVLLPFSFIIKEPQGFVPRGYSRKGDLDGVNLCTKTKLIFNSPEDAASYVLGQLAGLDEWIDSRGKGLLAYYKDLAEPKQTIAPQSVDGDEQAKVAESKQEQSAFYVFHIKKKGVCDASGYYDPISGHFFLNVGSKLSMNVSAEFSQTPVGKARERLITSNCYIASGFFVVKKNTKCRTATAAACYAMGKDVTYVEWETEDGKALKDLYPERFFRKKSTNEDDENVVSVPTTKQESQHIFFIKKTGENNKECDAKGYYDPVTNKFILLSGSTWTMEVSKSFEYTALDILRRNAIRKNCKLIFGAYKQSKDVLCDSPSQAASFVLGQRVNGWLQWKDELGWTLKDVFREYSED